jgi:hypothetical protein
MKGTTIIIFLAVLELVAVSVQSHQRSERRALSQQKPLTDEQRPTPDDMQREHIGLGVGRGEGKGRGQGSGQGHGCQMPTADDHLRILNEQLNLSDDQQATARVELTRQLELLDGVRKDKSLSHDGRISKIRSHSPGNCLYAPRSA